MRSRAAVLWNKMVDGLTVKKILLILLGAMICSFGIHNIHQRTNITEGGVIGLMLFAEHWLRLSPAYITPILDIACYLLAFRFLGGRFIKISIISAFFVSLFYKIWELFPPMLPDLSNRPLIAAVLGGMFVGIGVGLIVRQGGSSGGDDALALSISHLLRWRLSRSLSLYGRCGAAALAQLYPCDAHCLFAHHSDDLFVSYRLCQRIRHGEGSSGKGQPNPEGGNAPER